MTEGSTEGRSHPIGPMVIGYQWEAHPTSLSYWMELPKLSQIVLFRLLRRDWHWCQSLPKISKYYVTWRVLCSTVLCSTVLHSTLCFQALCFSAQVLHNTMCTMCFAAHCAVAALPCLECFTAFFTQIPSFAATCAFWKCFTALHTSRHDFIGEDLVHEVHPRCLIPSNPLQSLW